MPATPRGGKALYPRWLRAAFLCGAAAASALVLAQPQSTPTPVGPFHNAPPATRDFFDKAREADKIADPLQRCLAFPEVPGSQWPAGLARAYCHYLTGSKITMQEVRALLDKGALDELDGLYRRDLDRHFSSTDFSEVIHRDFHMFDAGDDAAELSRLWLEKAPRSGFALAARGKHLMHLAFKRRGGKWASETSDAQMAAMETTAFQAIGLLHDALKAEPRLMDAHLSLLEAARVSSQEDLYESTLRKARAIDPGCRHVSDSRMTSLQPRWGGSYQQMQAYAAQIEPLVSKRPLLALSVWAVADDMARMLTHAEKWDEAIKIGRVGAKHSPYPDLHTKLAGNLLRGSAPSQAQTWEAVTAMLTAYRFDVSNVYQLGALGRQLSIAGDNAWSRKVLLRADKLKPEAGYAAYLIGLSYLDEQRQAQAIPYLRRSMQDKDWRQESMRRLMIALVEEAQLEQADSVAVTYAKEFPNDPDGWWTNAELQLRMGRAGKAHAALANYLRTADRKDPTQQSLIDNAQQRHDAIAADLKAGRVK